MKLILTFMRNIGRITLLIILLFMCNLVFGQSKIYFDRFGKILYEKHKKGKQVTFRIFEKDKSLNYFLLYFELPEITMANPIIPAYKYKVFPATDSIELTVSSNTSYLQYQLVKLPAASISACANDGDRFQDILDNVDEETKSKLEIARKNLVVKLDNMTFRDARIMYLALDSLTKHRRLLPLLEDSLKRFSSSADSLSKKDFLALQNITARQKLLKEKLKILNNSLVASTQAKSDKINSQIIQSINQTTTELSRLIQDALPFEQKKQTYRRSRRDTLESQILKQKLAIAAIEKRQKPILDEIAKVDKLFTANVDWLYSGQLTFTNDTVKWVTYDTQINSKKELVGFNRVEGVLPKLNEFDYLGLHLINYPIALRDNPDAFRIEVNVTQATGTFDRWGGVRTEAESAEVRFDTKMLESFTFRDMQASGSESKVNCNVTFDEFSNKRIDEATKISLSKVCLEGQKVTDKNIKTIISAYQDLRALAQDFGEAKVAQNKNNQLLDYYQILGTRFIKNNIPEIKITGKGDEKSKPVYVSDKLEPVHRLYRFGVSTGLIFTGVWNYRYTTKEIPGTQNKILQEQSYVDMNVYPAMFFSYYPKLQNLDRQPNLKNSWSINLGVDYVTLLDNVYIGLGYEPVRHLQLHGGIRLGKVQKVTTDAYNTYSVDYQPYLKDTWRPGLYIGVNFFLNGVPTTIKSIFKKKLEGK